MPLDSAKNAWATSAAITSVTDSSGGTPAIDDEIAAVATLADAANAIALLAVKVNDILTALEAAGLIVAS